MGKHQSVSSERLAWLLADSLKTTLPDRCRSVVYMHLGCRDYRRAIAHALQSAVESGADVPDVLAGAVGNWLDAYDGHPEQEQLILILARLRENSSPDAAPRSTGERASPQWSTTR